MPAHLPSWAVDFHPFTWVHGVTLLWTVGAIIASSILGRRWLARGGFGVELEERLAGAWGGFVIAVNLWSLVYWSLPDQFDLKESLPLQLCDIACLLAPLVFLTRWRWPRTLLFFWGIGLSTQAFLTPTLKEGPAHMKYWLFWLVHLSIVGTAVYDLAVRRYRPALRDLLLAVSTSIAWALAMVALNTMLGSNYGYIGNTRPDQPTIIDKLGPWPERVFLMAAITISLFAIMWLIAGFIGRFVDRRPPRIAILHCRKCGYDLAPIAARTDHCPECGTPITNPGV